MLHNSAHRRDLLLSVSRHPLTTHRRNVHRTVSPRPGAKCPANCVELKSVTIQTARDHPAEQLLATDAADFLTKISVDVAKGAAGGATLLVELGSHPRGFRTLVDDRRLELHAADASSLWAAWTTLELQMRASGGPYLPKGENTILPAWPTQIAPPTWGSNYAVPDLSPDFLPDDTFRSLAHSGADGLFIYGDWLSYAHDTPLKELNHPDAEKNLATLRDAANRASNYGVQLHFVLVSPKLPADHPLFKRLPSTRGALLQHLGDAPPIHCLCSSDPDALNFHAAVVGGLFREIPTLGGIICIIGGESYYHCFMRSAGSPIGQTNCPHCQGKLAEDVIANLIKVTADAVHAHSPNALVQAWPYSAQYFWSHDRDQTAFIDRLPAGVTLLSEIDKEQVIHKPAGYDKLCWDYSVEYDGHSDRIVAQSLRCAQANRDLAIKTETAHGIELLHLPYVPAIGRSARRWQSVRSLRPRSVLQRWGFIGMFDSVAERLAFLARWDPTYSPDSAPLKVATQIAGPAVAPTLVQAWRHFDDSLSHLPTLTSGGYYKGPLFLGPACPLPTWTGPTPQAFLGNFFYLAEADPTGSSAHVTGNHDDFTVKTSAEFGSPPISVQATEYATARDLASQGHALLQKLDTTNLDPGTKEELAEQQSLGEYLYRTLRTCANLTQFLHLRDTKSPKDSLLAIATDERENTTAAQSLYQRTPWLNHTLRLDVGAPDSLAMTAEKLRLLDTFLKS